MRSWHLTWCGFAVLLVGAFLPLAQFDVRAAAESAEGLEAVAYRSLAITKPVVELTAWNATVPVGTAQVPVWVAVAACALASILATRRGGGDLAIPRGASPILAAVAETLLIVLALQDHVSMKIGGWISLLGAAGAFFSALRDPAPTPPGPAPIH